MSEPIDIESLDPLYRDVFRDSANGTAYNISKAGCLALAACGAVRWNAWREKFPTKGNQNHVDFSNHQFDVVVIDFSGFKFGDWADFRGTFFLGEAWFDGAVFGVGADFRGAQFAQGADFGEAHFAHFCSFLGTQFGEKVNFNEAMFAGAVTFRSASFGELFPIYNNCEEAQNLAKLYNLDPLTIRESYFYGCQFNGLADFSGRTFIGATVFGAYDESNAISEPATFSEPPMFYGCKLYQDTSFDRVAFPQASGSYEAARAYRTLKLAFSQQQAIREEQRFFKLEMAEEAARATGAQRFLYKAYSLCSDYGFSITRPAVLLAVTLAAMTLIYGVLSYLHNCLPDPATCHFSTAWIEFSLLQSLPLPGLDKLSDTLRGQLFPTEGLISIGVTVAVILHKAISLLALFLMGLALRNLFKLK